jgi:RNA polymerase sigma-70 factor (ECF subfamily)
MSNADFVVNQPPALQQSSDHSLLERYRAGNDEAATALYLRYAARLHQLVQTQCPPDLAQRVDADDIIQSVFSSFFRRARDGYYEVPKGEELWKLLLVMTLNKLRTQGNFHRAARRDVRLTQSVGRLERASDEQNDELALMQLRLVLAELMSTQSELSRQIVELRIKGHDVAEIAERVQRSQRTVERVLQSFRQLLQRNLAP